MNASETTRIIGYGGRLEYSASFSYLLDSKKIVQLLTKTDHLYPAQEGLGRIVGGDGDDVLMPAFMGEGEHPGHDLLKVSLKTGRGKTLASGFFRTRDWIADRDGTVLAREDYDNDSNDYEILTRREGKWRSVFQTTSARLPFSLIGIRADKAALILLEEGPTDAFAKVRELSFDGVMSAPIFERPDAEVEDVLLDINRAAIGAAFSGLLPSYDFYDDELAKTVSAFQAYFDEDAAYLIS